MSEVPPAAETDAPACGARYGRNPDLCHREPNHRGAHTNKYGTSWVTATHVSSRVLPPGADRFMGWDGGPEYPLPPTADRS